MVQNEEKLTKFNQAIHHYAEEQRKKIEEGVAKFKEKELDQAENEVLQEAYQLIQKEMAQMRNNITKEMAHREMDARHELLGKRQNIMKSVFEQATQQLKAFADSPKYADWMDSHCRSLSGAFDNTETVLFVRPEDLKLEAAIVKAFAKPCCVQADNEIHLGGIRAQNASMGLVADDTLDALLENQQEWFEENSGLRVQ